jgi:hypothetical protein
MSSIAKVNVFYNDVSYTAYVENPSLTGDVLLGNIGGVLGLFIGISIMSLMEVFELFIEFIKIIYHHNKESNKVTLIQIEPMILK